MQEYSCGHLVCAGICLQSQNPLIYVHTHALAIWLGYLASLISARVRIFHSECQRELAMASSEPSTSRLPEEDSSDMDSDSDNEVSQIDIDSQISTSIRSSKSAKK